MLTEAKRDHLGGTDGVPSATLPAFLRGAGAPECAGAAFWRRALMSCVGLSMLLALVGTTTATPQAAGRVALVVGNSTYGSIGDLPNPGNDAADVGAALGRLGFEVTTILDANQVRFNQALLDFTRRSVGAEVALVFYAGHGLEVDGVNYMVPVNARLERDTDVRFAAVSLENVLAATQGAALRVVILDACRNNPLARTMQRTSATRNISRGSFGELDEEALGDETLVAYAAAAGTTADDGTGRNSPYTTALLEYLEQPLELSAVFRRVRARVLETTAGRQRPHEYGALLRDHYLSGTSGVVTTPALAAVRLQQEIAFWQSIAASDNPADFEAYLEQYAAGRFARLAENRLAALREARPAVVDRARPSDSALRDPLTWVADRDPTADPSAENVFWESVRDSSIFADFENYLSRWPDGTHSRTARRKLVELAEAELLQAARRNDAGAVPALVARGASVEAHDGRGNTPLHYAAQTNAIDTIDVLMALGAVAGARNTEGNTPLHYAVLRGAGDAVHTLLQAGAGARVRNERGLTPLDIARMSGANDEIVKRLEQ